MIRDEHQDRLQHATAGEDASLDFFESVRAETKPSFAGVLSIASGDWFFWRCHQCQRTSGLQSDKARAQELATRHNESVHS